MNKTNQLHEKWFGNALGVVLQRSIQVRRALLMVVVRPAMISEKGHGSKARFADNERKSGELLRELSNRVKAVPLRNISDFFDFADDPLLEKDQKEGKEVKA
jgi:hypothetical protein